MIITCEQLKTATGCKTVTALENTLRSQGIKYLYGKKGAIFTTETAINAAMGLNYHKHEEKQPIELL